MPAPRVWGDFEELPDRIGAAKQGVGGSERKQRYKRWKCPHCKEAIEVLVVDSTDRKSDTCKTHFWNKTSPCPNRPVDDLRGKPKSSDADTPAPKRRKSAPRSPHRVSSAETTIYALVDMQLLKPIYTGKTVDAHRRLGQHRSDSSSCRLVAQFVRKHGKARVGIRPLVRCSDADGDTNESFYIMKNNTLYPNGLNLRHGSMAGVESDECTALVPVAAPQMTEKEQSTMMAVHAQTVEPIEKDMLSTAAAWADVAAMCAAPDDESSGESGDESEGEGPVSGVPKLE